MVVLLCHVANGHSIVIQPENWNNCRSESLNCGTYMSFEFIYVSDMIFNAFFSFLFFSKK